MVSMQLLTDDELVKGFIEGKDECIGVLVNRHKNRVFTYILINVKKQDLAEDIFQDTFYKVFQSLRSGKYVENGKFSSWMMRIAHNLVIDHYRRLKNQNVLSAEETLLQALQSPRHADASIEDKMAYEQILKDVSKLIDHLPDVQREVVQMRFYQDLSFKEIAEDTNVSINTALGRLRYAIINLRKLVEEKNISLSV
jgi:RNA polymerase sigma factor (sigma-70 family)